MSIIPQKMDQSDFYWYDNYKKLLRCEDLAGDLF